MLTRIPKFLISLKLKEKRGKIKEKRARKIWPWWCPQSDTAEVSWRGGWREPLVNILSLTAVLVWVCS